MVPRCLAAASGRGFDSDGCDASPAEVAEAMEAGFLPALDEDQANMFTPSELCLYRQLLRDPSLFGDITWLTPDIKIYPVFRWKVEVRRGVSRPAAAARLSRRQPGAEMNELYGMSASAGISQDNSVFNYYPDLFRVIQVRRSYPNLSRDMQV